MFLYFQDDDDANWKKIWLKYSVTNEHKEQTNKFSVKNQRTQGSHKTDERTNTTNEQTDGQTDKQTIERTNERTDERTNERGFT